MSSILLMSLLVLRLWAVELPHGFTSDELEKMAHHNATLSMFERQMPGFIAQTMNPEASNLLETTTARPYAEYESAGYLIFSETFSYSSKAAKLAMAENLPKDVQLIIYTTEPAEAKANKIRETYRAVIDPSRITVVAMPKAERGFWTRDGVPVPVYRQSSDWLEPKFSVVDAKYYHRFEPDQEFSHLFSSLITQHPYYFEGGNFIANSKNECLVINNRTTREMPESLFLQHYGCQRLIRLPHVKGIGHADESVKFLSDREVITDEPSYVSVLAEAGYEVKMLPRPQNEYETYVNSLVVNGVVYVPTFKQATDNEALQVYESFGLRAVALDSRDLSNNGMGSIHCITMTYPPIPMAELLRNLNAKTL